MVLAEAELPVQILAVVYFTTSRVGSCCRLQCARQRDFIELVQCLLLHNQCSAKGEFRGETEIVEGLVHLRSFTAY